jgi:glycosyltransferase involved in cell wall biosynthesis
MTGVSVKKVSILINDITNSAGTERAVVNLANLLSATERYLVSIISCCTSEGTSYFLLNREVDLIHLGLGPVTDSGIKKADWYFKLIKTLRKIRGTYRYDILIGTTHASNSVLPFISAGTKTITIGCEHLNYDSAPSVSKILRRFIYPFIKHLVVLTNTDKQRYSFINSVSVIPNSQSFATISQANLENKQILAIGRYSAQKGFATLIEIADRIKPVFPDWKIKIIGKGELKDVLVQKAKMLNVDDYVHFVEPTKNIIEEYLASSIYVMTSLYEGLPMVLIEAKSCGLPIVSFNCPEGPADIVKDGEDGYLIDPGNVDLFVNKLTKLMNDSSLRMKFSEMAKKNSLEYSGETILIKWETLLNNLN